MRIIGCDLHAQQQTIALLDRDTGEIVEKTLRHEDEEVRAFYGALRPPVVVGLEATGSMGWFLKLLDELAIEYRVGHPAAIRKAETRRQKHDRRDASLILQLLMEDRFPAIWMPSTEYRDLRALLLHRHQWVRFRARVKNALQAIALGQGLRRGPALWTRDGQARLASLPLTGHTADRRQALQALYQSLDTTVDHLDRRVAEVARDRAAASRLMTHPGVGHVTALATEVFLGDPRRFGDAKALGSYIGMIPAEYSSGAKQRLGRLTKQGNPFLRFLWCEAAIHAVQQDAHLKRFYRRIFQRRGLRTARVAAGRKLGIRLWIMLRDQIDYDEFCRRAPVNAAAPTRECLRESWS